MWFEVVMKPIKERLGKLMIWCDDCGSHKTSSVKDVIAETDIDVAFLPPNMTAELQVLELVMNGPIKAHIKNKRAIRLYDSFQIFKMEKLAEMELPLEQQKTKDFTPPKPTMLQGIRDLILLFEEQFTEEKFMKCIQRAFVNTGTLPIVSEDLLGVPKFREYAKVSSYGTLSVIPQGTLDFESETVEDGDLESNEGEEFERALFSRYIDDIDRHVAEEGEDLEESNESDDEAGY